MLAFGQSPTVHVHGLDKQKDAFLGLSKLSIQVEIIANLATTTFDMTFQNTHNRILEGELQFPLAEGQSVSRFAMDVDGKLREAVVVEKEKGRQTFESIERRRVDPGLLEQTKGNNFKARVYPIPAKGEKHIVVAYEHELLSKDGQLVYELPLDFKDKIASFSISLNVFKQNIQPIVKNKNDLDFTFEKWQESYRSSKRLTNYLANTLISIALPTTNAEETLFVGDDSHPYFYLNTKLKKITEAKKMPQNIAIAYDVSGSALKRDIEKEFALLKSYLELAKPQKVSVICFSNDIHSQESFQLKNGVEKILTYLKAQKFDGATQLGVLDFSKLNADEVLLFTDGLSNFGSNDLTRGKTKIYTINSSRSADFSTLRYIAQSSGGQTINLVSSRVDDALPMLTTNIYSFLYATYKKNQVTEVYPTIATPVNNSFSLAGQLLSKEAEIVLNFGFADKVVYQKKIKLERKTSASNDFVTRIWAQKKLAELNLQYEKNKTLIKEFGKKHSIVTRETSLIVLDLLSDYVRYEITPPAELLEKYEQEMANKVKSTSERKVQHLEFVHTMFQDQQKWWAEKEQGREPRKKYKARITEPAVETLPEVVEEDEALDEIATADSDISFFNSEGIAISAQVAIHGVKSGKQNGSRIVLKEWDPKTPYLTRLKNSEKNEYLQVYFEEREHYAQSTSFYLDVADFMYKKNEAAFAQRILSNIAEMQLENHQLLRILGKRLQQQKEYKLAISVFREVLKIRGEEPQSYRDLALVLAANGDKQEAIELLYHVVETNWDGRFSNIELIALNELNKIIETSGEKLNTAFIDKRFLKNLPVDIRIVLEWDADNTDIDLWVIEPNKEKCFYSHKNTRIGGRMSADFTDGYGPEVYMLKEAIKGRYLVQANYYGNRQQILAGATTIQLTLITDFGRKTEKTKSITLQLKDEKQVIDVGELLF